ncbi:hypothetical protein NGA_0418200 [Nannochloropsis gaditana CCMP526]|uniref:Uncharacterized protein n=1 Tax=Nannochloropsis gaditana TaxID=72520 RepID=W7THG7_9STRA|nr:hypothetical protein NGA_0418200 [Nannochloropsis gaditana CCMP526]EKU21525.1 hypothetical protein NGA_0418200 [Nannochloropsis gaditana CCMP526]EWM20409.1 hypothetical protein Naga_101237g2 [Nannochloropsis gaditana]|eukprot:XP_005854832.1 hypothetical protein NGA_0418200 [Nannochloropsis gaditana CCMP526]
MARERNNPECVALLEMAEKAYLMRRARRLLREGEAWAHVLEDTLRGMPRWLTERVRGAKERWPYMQPEPDLDEEVVETEDGKQDLKEEGGGTGWESEACELRSPLYSFSDACEELEEEEEEEVGEGGDGREEKVLFDCPSLYFAAPPSTSPSQPSVLPPYFHAFSTAFASPFCRQMSTTTPRREGEEEEAQDKARQAASVDSAVAHYVKRRMSYDVFLTLQELVV